MLRAGPVAIDHQLAWTRLVCAGSAQRSATYELSRMIAVSCGWLPAASTSNIRVLCAPLSFDCRLAAAAAIGDDECAGHGVLLVSISCMLWAVVITIVIDDVICDEATIRSFTGLKERICSNIAHAATCCCSSSCRAKAGMRSMVGLISWIGSPYGSTIPSACCSLRP